MRRRRHWWAGALAVLVAAGCADDDPTGVGAPFLEGDPVRTLEIVLDAAEFLAATETHDRYSRSNEADWILIGSGFGDSIDARGLVRFARPPASITYDDANDESQTDEEPTFIGGTVKLVVDTAKTSTREPIDIALYRVTEDWDAQSATWTMRLDSGSVREGWTEAGGSPGERIDVARWEPDTDTLEFAVDSQTVAAWSDPESNARGAVVVAETPGERIFLEHMRLEYRARPSIDPDTTVEVLSAIEQKTFIRSSEPPSATTLRVGGTPAWRSFLRFHRRLDTLALSLPIGDDTLHARIGSVEVNYVGLRLRPTESPDGYVPEDSIALAAFHVFTSPRVPLRRAPLAVESTAGVTRPFAPGTFAGADGDAVELNITPYFRAISAPPRDGAEEDAGQDNVLALLDPSGPTETFGFGSFGAPGPGASGPTLRMIITVFGEDVDE